MSIIRQLTEAESDLAAKEQLVLQAGEATHHLASTLATTNAQFWSLPTDRLLAVLNADIPATLATFAANTALGVQVNASLDALAVPQFATRAPVTAGRSDIVFNGSAFEYIAPEPNPEPDPEPDPDPDPDPEPEPDPEPLDLDPEP